jgi:hypothetical protein
LGVMGWDGIQRNRKKKWMATILGKTNVWDVAVLGIGSRMP